MKAVKVDRGGKEVPSRTNDGLEVPTLHQWCQDVICNGTRAAEGNLHQTLEIGGAAASGADHRCATPNSSSRKLLNVGP